MLTDELTQIEVVALFKGYIDDPILYATLEGNRGGRNLVDHPVDPRAAFVWTNCECAGITIGEDDGEFQQALQESMLEQITPMEKIEGQGANSGKCVLKCHYSGEDDERFKKYVLRRMK